MVVVCGCEVSAVVVRELEINIEIAIEYLRLLTINLGKKSSALGTHNM
jgi:hypothetical protein